MKILCLLLLLLPKWAGATTFATGTTAFYLSTAGELVDATGTFSNLVENGAVAGVTSPVPCSGSTFYGVYSNTDYYTLPADLLTAMAGYTSWSIEFCVNTVAMTGSPIPFGDGANNFLQLNTTGAIRWGTSGGVLGFGANSVSNGTSYKVLVVFDNSTGKKTVYFNDSVTPYMGPSTQAASSAFANLKIGKYSGGTEAVNGYISNFRVMNIAAVPPLVDVSNGSRSIKWERMLSPRWGRLLDFATQAYAYPPDQWAVSKDIAFYNGVLSKTKVASDVTKGVVTRTVTPTISMTSTLTPLVTPTLTTTVTLTPTTTLSFTITPTPSISPTFTVTPTPTVSPLKVAPTQGK